jgi:inner membrane protein
MDNLTHTLSGLIAARLYPAQKLSMKTRYIAGALAANVPDLDILLAPISSQLYIMHHRGETHSLLMLPLWALLLSWVFSRVFNGSNGWKDFYGLATVALMVHIIGDWITGYGTQLFAPFTNQTYSLGTTFIIDPVLTLILLGGFAAGLFMKNSMKPARVATLGVAIWIGTQFYWKQEAIKAGHAYAESQDWKTFTVSAEPRPLAPFNWTILIQEGNRYHYAHLKLNAQTQQTAAPDANWLNQALASFQPPALASWQTVAKFGNGLDNTLARDIWARPEFEFFRWFASAPALYRIDHHPNGPCVWFQDLRFVAPGRDGPFRFGLCGPEWKAYRLDRSGTPRLFD